MANRLFVRIAVVLPVVLAATTSPATAQTTSSGFPGRVLITNDNGIDDPGLVELARAFAGVPGTEVYVVAATQDRSGTSNFLGTTREGRFRVERRNLGANIQAWALDGYPADCVLFALTGPLRDRFPDVVVSGINGGPNLADDWFGSGTIGAARTAAYFGVPAVAVSGLDDDIPGAIEATTSWVVRFVRSDLVAALERPQYLTVSLPVGPPSNIKGARIVERARGITWGRARPVGARVARDSVLEWQLQIETRPHEASRGSDVRAVAEGFIAIVPMRVDEFDVELMRQLRRDPSAIPDWAPHDDGGREPEHP